jgi:fumarate hydratase, class II
MNFQISTERMPQALITALAHIKACAAAVNCQLGLLDEKKAHAIARAAGEVISGMMPEAFPLSVWQTGSGTHTNMNVNEVLANRASQLLGGAVGQGRLVHPNDDVNLGQSSNDVFPSAMSIAVSVAITAQLLPALTVLINTLDAKATAFAYLVKLGRTHGQDALPLTLGQEISGWSAQLQHCAAHVREALPHLFELALGAGAVGTGLNVHPEFGQRMADALRDATHLPLRPSPNKFEALAANDAMVFAHGAFKTLACSLHKIANDVRWMASGPRSGLGEISIPNNEPGSSMMPGKANPTQCEALTMIACQVLGNDVAVNMAGASGSFELNVYKPVILHNTLQSVRLLSDGMRSFETHCARGIEANREHLGASVRGSLMLVTALAPHLGYDRAAIIAQKATAETSSLRDAAIASGLIGAADFDQWVQPDTMVGPSATPNPAHAPGDLP